MDDLWGDGYWVNPGAGNRNWWFTGWQVQCQLLTNVTPGVENAPQANPPPAFDTAGAESRPPFSFSARRQLGKLLPCRTRAERVQIRAHLRERAEAEACLLDHVQHRPIGALDQCELVAQEPFAVRELTFEDADHVGQSF